MKHRSTLSSYLQKEQSTKTREIKKILQNIQTIDTSYNLLQPGTVARNNGGCMAKKMLESGEYHTMHQAGATSGQQQT